MSTPYDLVEVRVLTGNGKMSTLMRPYMFDSEPVDMNTLKNHFGNVIRPIKLTASCPHCGSLLDVEVSSDMTYKCEECYKEPKRKVFNPFVIDPLEGIMHLIYSDAPVLDGEVGGLEHLLDGLIASPESPFDDDGFEMVKRIVVTHE